MATTATARQPWPRLPRWTRRTHPIVRAEMRRLGRMRWPLVGRGGWWSALLLFAALLVPALLALVILFGPTVAGADRILVVGTVLALTAVAASGLINWFTGLAATVVGATQIAQEREDQRWTYLRVTTLQSTEIVGGKLAALLRLLSRRMHLAAGLRVFALAAGAVTLIALSGAGPTSWSSLFQGLDLPGEILRSLPDSFPVVLAVSVGGLDLLLGLLYWFLEPYFNGTYNALVGLAASTLARRRGPAIGLAFVAHLALALVVYWPAQQLAFGLWGGLVPSSASLGADTLLGILLAGTVQFSVFIGLRVAVMFGCLGFSINRVEQLGE